MKRRSVSLCVTSRAGPLRNRRESANCRSAPPPLGRSSASGGIFSHGLEDCRADGFFRRGRERLGWILAAQGDRAPEGREEHLAVVTPVQVLADLLAGVVRQFPIEIERQPPEDLQAMGLTVARVPMGASRASRRSTRWPRHRFLSARAAAGRTSAPGGAAISRPVRSNP